MPIVTWSEEYDVNVEKIDKQHRHLLQLVNDLHAAVEACIDKNKLRKMLIELTEFTRTHFATEEQLMIKHDYPEKNAHQKEHKMLLRHLGDLVTAVSNGKYPTFYSDYDVSTDWALVHINEYDKPLGDFLNQVG
ncbi:MAG: hemerythrin family protein [Chromatiaceae bacterium]|nr:hemerythrin family protein [Gammaproteobacteria bacterium]MCP5427945.1 hemerythrin family protein [Chromatiaceae bacterium]MCB1863165.1 hemerythrin family protein [Gammaproteobacteria bacterium]MCB1870732.1 hemerythrin family protein [Gammaproteobacteria bacterium]MCB1881903.1 hemerythrin family protein [Gammaproteobacteria bacterium]